MQPPSLTTQVFKICSNLALVKNAPSVLANIKRLGLQGPANFVLTHTMFKQFCGGQNLFEVARVMQGLKASGVGSILDLAFEADETAGEKSIVQAHAEALRIGNMMRQSIDAASLENGSYVALKITALVPPLILQRWSNSLAAASGSKATGIERDTRHLLPLSSASSNEAKETECLRASDFQTIDLLFQEINSICQYAADSRVKVLIDAEQTYFQPAIDAVTLKLCSNFNQDGTLIYNTYQLYLKDGFSRMQADIKSSHDQGFHVGGKLAKLPL
jgi:proline dehydrogenase